MISLRPYQVDVVNAVKSGWREFRKQLIVVPTGGGKTLIFSHLAQDETGRVLILAHREELISQAADKLKSSTGIVADREKAEDWASLSARVVVGSVQTLINDARRERWPKDHFSLVVVDEGHHAISDSYRKVLSHFDGHAKVLAVTATPDRGDKKNLGEYFENIAAEVKLFDLVNAGYLAPITLKSIPLAIDLSGVKSVAGDFSGDDLGKTIEPYLPAIAASIKEHASFRRVLAFLPLIHTSHKFVDACRKAGMRAGHVDGNSPGRADILERFRRWEFDVLSNAMLLTEGFDDPGIDCVCVLRPTRSRPLYAQMVGRGTRTHDTKENLLLLDFLFSHERLSIVRPAHLIAKSEEEAEQITTIAKDKAAGGEQFELELQGLASEAAAQREAALAKKLAEHKNRKSKTLSAEEFALAHHAMDVAEFEPSTRGEMMPVTDKQAKYLRQAGIELDTVHGRAHASQLLNIFFSNKKLQLATASQQQLMRRMGHTSPETATADEARKFFAGLRKKAE